MNLNFFRHTLIFAWLVLILTKTTAQNTLTATYTSDIPTSFNSYDNSCNGPSSVIIITLPVGESYTVTNVDVSYNMTAQGTGWKSHQRSKIRFENTGISEPEVSGTGATSGTQMYSRSISIANGTYNGDTQLIFQMQAMRTSINSPNNCNTSFNRVDASTWTITVHYSNEILSPKVGINTTSPSTTLDVNGVIRVGNITQNPLTGTIRFNPSTSDFEGFNGYEWLSFTTRIDEEWRSGNISEKVSNTASDGVSGDNFGTSVAISGDYAIVGSPFKDVGSSTNQGKAYIYKRSGTTWIQESSFTASDGTVGDGFGTSVAISGDYAIVGSPFKDVGSNTSQGKAYIFKRSGFNWLQESIIIASDGGLEDNFGTAVSISGDYVIVSAINKDLGTNINQGEVYIFKRSGTIWNQEIAIVLPDGESYDQFGNSVYLDGNYAIVAARNADATYTDQGKAIIYRRSGNVWIEEAVITATDDFPYDYFGASVCISGDFAIIGNDNRQVGSNSGQGKAYIFKRTGTSWSQQYSLIASDGATGDKFGNSVGISGDYAIIGSYLKDVSENMNQGKAYIFKRTGTIWTQQAELIGSGANANDEFGTSVFVSGNHVIIGAPFKDVGSNTNEGKVFFFSKE